ncbi:hypothetical protein WDJ51_04925 [Rathayibacter sp. YIM 133350]|uniref:hypothetical protein n=1 Tax=Rathayibacter sp. YIM 133350 TaxID=3131992 RepID=UPI00307E2410
MATRTQSTATKATTPPAEPQPANAPEVLAETSVLPPFSPELEAAEAIDPHELAASGRPDAAPAPAPGAPASGAAVPAVRSVRTDKPSWFSQQPLRLMLVVIIGVIALFFAFGLLIIFSPTNASVAALAVIATPIASMVAAYYGITLSMQQVRTERTEKEKALARLVEAEKAARDADVWAAQMESGLRVAKVKLDAARITSTDVSKAAGVTDEFF